MLERLLVLVMLDATRDYFYAIFRARVTVQGVSWKSHVGDTTYFSGRDAWLAYVCIKLDTGEWTLALSLSALVIAEESPILCGIVIGAKFSALSDYRYSPVWVLCNALALPSPQNRGVRFFTHSTPPAAASLRFN